MHNHSFTGKDASARYTIRSKSSPTPVPQENLMRIQSNCQSKPSAQQASVNAQAEHPNMMTTTDAPLQNAEPPFVVQSSSPKVNTVTGSSILSKLKQLKAMYKSCSDDERLVFLTSALANLPLEQKEKIKDLFLDDMEDLATGESSPAPMVAAPAVSRTETTPTPPPRRNPSSQSSPQLQTEAEKQAYIRKKMQQIELESRANEPNIRKQMWGCIGLILLAALLLVIASVAGGELWNYLKDTFFPSTPATP